ncbi:MAG: ATP-dependent DNA helicase [Proteobacteria bacterium]|nr:ATP-dependent DNA helicase [Burkholderiales bacterium]
MIAVARSAASTADAVVVGRLCPVAGLSVTSDSHPHDAFVFTLNASLEHVFSAEGPLARAVPGYRPRPGQVELASAIARTLRDQGVLVAEAGTGTGKTFAYLVPALLSGAKVIISTGTKTLQDQLFERDLPLVRAALNVPIAVALLKGRSNYLCHYHLERNAREGLFSSAQDVRHFREIERFAKTSKTGDRSELAAVPDTAPAWAWATSTRENCLGAECAHFQRCFVMEARRNALAADLVVVNHHLFFADVALRDTGFAELLPTCDAVIFDEAHALPDTASMFFGESVSTTQMLDLARDTRGEALAGARDYAPLPVAASAFEKATRDLRLAVREESGRLSLRLLRERPTFTSALDHVLATLMRLGEHLAEQSERSEGLEKCTERATALYERLERWRVQAAHASTDLHADVRHDDARGADGADDTEGGWVLWGETFAQSLQLHATPLSIARIFRQQMGTGASVRARAWVFTSATLSIDGDFSHYAGTLGLADAECAAWPSPFDFARQSLLYVPPGMPEPNTPDYVRAVVDAALPVIEAAGGRTFVLCTSLRAMRAAHALLDEAFRRRGLLFPLMVQGEGPRNELLERFRSRGDAVLVASHSFWEGVDVRGDALSVVVIDKLPFAPPDDPVLAARIEHVNRSGGNAFGEIQLPQAAITLKQGAGRLIRDETDRGVLMICDPRLLSKGYGRKILKSLPPMTLTRELNAVQKFFRE